MSAQQQQQTQLLEVMGFLSDAQPQVRRIALASLLPYTAADKSERQIFTRDHYLEQIATMCADQELIAHDALSALINLTSSISIAARLAKIDGFITGLVRMIIDEKALLSDLATMLLSNMSKVEHVSMLLLGLRVPFTVAAEAESTSAEVKGEGAEKEGSEPKKPKLDVQGVEEEVRALDLLLEVFLKGEGKKYNPQANYDFLASVFANVSTIPLGRSFLLSTPSPELEPPLAKLISFTEHPSPIRRGGVASCIKNSAFQKASHARLIAPTNEGASNPGSIDLLTQMLLPLCSGDEEFDIDVLDTLPADLQLLPPDKKREPDAAIRLILVETLVLLATTRQCRESMRTRGVYEVIKKAHAVEKAPKVTEPMVRLVNLLMREEGPDTAIEELDTTEEDTARPTADTVFVSADGAEVKEHASEEEAEEEVADEYVPFQREPVEKVESEDEEEMLLEV